ncbi:hypothetical protein RGU72_04680 [Undibacterium sp. 5I1]|uniref:hypothetical protein n=1 Tax=unclassified Undibacterium TaxID=2630295 RepID=UPI002AB51F36|nr:MULTISPECIES: hypothetical protein [unclassified Undibacterium]MDY7537547.1 hypothetical protein [Undibacterium sp. 5I1]MEB0231931.1 hypothetical protein [Undibacterium sp. 10I3]MEB0256282.1 hypothetical protein [Undibacterium sp. 5I1]
MNSKDYIKNATATESVPASIEIDQVMLHASLTLMIKAAELGDLIKRKIYYGKAFDQAKLKENLSYVTSVANFISEGQEAGVDFNTPKTQEEARQGLPAELRGISLNNINPRLLHAAIGCFTESGELLDSVIKQYETGVIDLVNFKEEVGDLQWYQAIGCSEIGADLDELRDVNIAKLKARYPNKFSNEAALNRDTSVEREILNGSSL